MKSRNHWWKVETSNTNILSYRKHTIETTRCGNSFLSSETNFISTNEGVPRGRHIFGLYCLVWREMTPEHPKKAIFRVKFGPFWRFRFWVFQWLLVVLDLVKWAKGKSDVAWWAAFRSLGYPPPYLAWISFFHKSTKLVQFGFKVPLS